MCKDSILYGTLKEELRNLRSVVEKFKTTYLISKL